MRAKIAARPMSPREVAAAVREAQEEVKPWFDYAARLLCLLAPPPRLVILADGTISMEPQQLPPEVQSVVDLAHERFKEALRRRGLSDE